jgi:1,2-diacylglycerol 3-beta-glucosyltransferase
MPVANLTASLANVFLSTLVTGILLIGVSYLLVCGIYLVLLVLATTRYRARPASTSPAWYFTVLIPAHNEALVIEETVARLRRQAYPAALWRMVVIADNCSDDTAARAATAGAEVLVRNDPSRPGKGAALGWAIDRLSGAPSHRAIAVIDADSTASPEWLRRADAYLESGDRAVQSFYGIANADEGWRARLLSVSLILFHHVRSAGRDAMGWSSGLKGNGMVFAQELLEQHPWSAFSITEDLEYASCLANAGVRVAYDGGSQTLGLAGVRRGATTQRLRWEGGRFSLLRQWVPRLLARAVRYRSLLRADAAMELLVLPLALLAGVASLVLGLSALTALAGLTSWALVIGALFAAGLLVAYVLLGLRVAHAPRRMYATLGLAPAYLVWKAALYARLAIAGRSQRWIRTERT